MKRLQFFEMFDADGRLLWKRLLPMEFVLIERDAFEDMARSVGFRVVQLYGRYDRSAYDSAHSPVMIWDLQKPS